MDTALVTRADFPHLVDHTTRWKDNDVYGHMNNVVHYELFDSTVNQWLIQRGLLNVTASTAIGVVAESGCRYLAELKYPGMVTAGLRVARLGNSSIRYELALFAEGEEKAAAVGHFVHVYVDAQTRKPCPIPTDTRAAASSLMV
ncbi:acyl-CoA thioesterase [Thioclava sp. FR2]|uniref:acyl-CoA thioesterase n=1 Tax=Thioclava sp. FR2 TaxID=3445780 RepID=UPI003EC0150E